MVEWNTLSAKFPQDELDEIERIKEQYSLSYNEIIRSGVKFYIGLTLAKEMLAEISSENKIKIKNKDLGEILNSPNYQGNLEQKISKLVKILVVELIEKGLFKAKDLITHTFSLEEIDKAFQTMHDKPDDYIKAVIKI